MGQHTSRPAVEHTGPRSPTSQLSPSHAWPSWASSLTHGLPPDGDKGLFRGEFILVQAPFTGTLTRNAEAHPRVSQLYRHQFRSHTIALPDIRSTGSLTRLHRQGITRVLAPYQNTSVSRDAGPTHMTLPQSRGFTRSLRHQLGHITEEEDEAFPDDVNQCEKISKNVAHIRAGNETSLRFRSAQRKEKGDETDDEDYNEDDDDDDDEVSALSEDRSHLERNSFVSKDQGVPYHYFANHLVKPFFVTSQRFGSFQTMTAQNKSPFPLPRPNVIVSKSLPRARKHVKHGLSSRKVATFSRRNGFTTFQNRHPFERAYKKHDLTDDTRTINLHSQSPKSWKAQNPASEYELYNDYTEIFTYPPTAKLYEGRRPPSPIQDYSSSESGISDDYGSASKIDKKSSSRKSEATKTSSSDESNRLYKRRKSSSADSAMKDFDLLSSFSSDSDDKNDDDVFKGGSPRSKGTTARSDLSDSSSNSNSSRGRFKGRNSLTRRPGRGKKGKIEEPGSKKSRRKNIEKLTKDDDDDKTLWQRQKKYERTTKTLHSENTWSQLKSCLVNDDSRETVVEKSLHDDSFLGANETRRRSMPNRDLSLDSDYGELNRTGKSSRSASHKSVAFADDTLDTSLANSSSKNISKSLADIINTSLIDGTYSSRKSFTRTRSTPTNEGQEIINKKQEKIADNRDENEGGKEVSASTLSTQLKAAALQKTARSNSADSFLSSSNCTDKIKKLQDILIKQALPFANPDVLLSTQSKRSAKIDAIINKVENLEDSFNTYTQVEEQPSTKQHTWHSRSEGDLAINHKTDELSPNLVPISDTLANKKSVSATVIPSSPGRVSENKPAVPHPPPPPAPPLPDFLNKGVTLLKTSAPTEVNKSKNISIIKVNKTMGTSKT